MLKIKRIHKNVVLIPLLIILGAALIFGLVNDQIETKKRTESIRKTENAIAFQSPTSPTPATSIFSNALFIGNSLLEGNYAFGMAASDSHHDYYHYVTSEISNRNPSFLAKKVLGKTWEEFTSIGDQNDWLNKYLLPELSPDLDLVLIQLGDNINTPERLAVFGQGSINMLKFIQQQCPKVHIVWVGEWFSNVDRQTLIARACAETGCQFVDISDLCTVANQSAIGNIIRDDDGTTMTVTDDGVAIHPGDAGMLGIANRNCYKMGITQGETEIS